jgi:DNA-binding IclR family transcriptional regulator
VECASVDNTSAQKMAAILTALRALTAENQSPVTVDAIARRLQMPMRTVRDTLTLMERLGLVRRVDGRGMRSRWLLGREGL